ncbi:MAG: glycerophosphodiester phosphodiesterase [Parasporobacterium sp.]|nr:glycerophosphodiester phosphodiesterase [Parasporobacterium sp.]
MKTIKHFFWFICGFFIVWLFLLYPGKGKKKKMEFFTRFRYAHRGYHNKQGGIPENSMEAFKRAIDNGFGIELDVHISKDGRLVVMHDDNLLRTTGKNMLVESATTADIDNLRLEGSDEKVPYLENVLKLVDGQVPLLIELKPSFNMYKKLCVRTFKLLDKYKGPYMIESFDPRILMWINSNRPRVVKGQLAGRLIKHGEDISPIIDTTVKQLLLNFLARPDFIAYAFADRNALSLRLCKGLYHVIEFNWTIKSKEEQEIAERDDAVIIFEQFDPR